MEIIPATPGDASTLVALEASCFAEPWMTSTLAAALEDPKYLVLLARDGDSTIGYVLGWSVGEEAELARVGVLPIWRGRGIGEELTRAFFKALATRGVHQVFLEVRASNQAARVLYRKCSFSEIAARQNYYPDGENAVVMRAFLSGG